MSASGAHLGALTIAADRIDSRVRPRLLKEAVVMYQANRRQGTHDTRTRAEVAYSTRKLWKQKGTGRARPGSRRNPVWVGGGIIFGPHPRDYSYAIHRQQRRVATRSALLSMFASRAVKVVDRIELESPRTRLVAQMLRNIGVEGRCLIGTAAHDPKLALAARNLPGVSVARFGDFNAESVLIAGTIVLTADAFRQLQDGEVFVTRRTRAATR
jgi:large subunit ribosomal protein L4